jgi:predicted transglutaminase-like cysteine proteinase
MTATARGWLSDAARLAQLRAVAALVHAAPYTPDTVSDWRSDLTGDCQGKSQWAFDALEAMGWPADAMEFWACDLPDGKRHAVLVINVTLEDGTVCATAVDCRHQTPMRMDDLGYKDWSFVS